MSNADTIRNPTMTNANMIVKTITLLIYYNWKPMMANDNIIAIINNIDGMYIFLGTCPSFLYIVKLRQPNPIIIKIAASIIENTI